MYRNHRQFHCLTYEQDKTVLYSKQSEDSDVLIAGDGGSEDLEVERAWKMYGASLTDLSE